MRKTLEIVGFGLVAVLMASDFASCSSAKKAGIILNVSTAPDVDRSAITALSVTVNGRTQSYSEHFKAWANLSTSLTLGKMYEAMLLVEAGGGTGSIDFTTGTVTAQ